MNDGYTLVIGNRSYSSWSLRPWLALKATGQPFTEVVVPLRKADTKSALLTHSPTGKVPVLKQGDVTIWDSLAISEYLAERHPEAGLWPNDTKARAIARSVTAEMHSGFQDLRRNLFMDLRRDYDAPDRVAAAAADIGRVEQIWRDCRKGFGAGGPFLFGRFSIADCFYAPVCTRLLTWKVPVSADTQAYIDAVMDHPAMREWVAAAKAEPWTIDYLALA